MIKFVPRWLSVCQNSFWVGKTCAGITTRKMSKFARWLSIRGNLFGVSSTLRELNSAFKEKTFQHWLSTKQKPSKKTQKIYKNMRLLSIIFRKTNQGPKRTILEHYFSEPSPKNGFCMYRVIAGISELQIHKMRFLWIFPFAPIQ